MLERFSQRPWFQFLAINLAVLLVLIPIGYQYRQYQNNQTVEQDLRRRAESLVDQFLGADATQLSLFQARLAAKTGDAPDLETFRRELREGERYEAVVTRLISRLRRQKSQESFKPDTFTPSAPLEPDRQRLRDLIHALGEQAG